MEATIVDLRYRMNDVLKALERNEDVSVLCRGKVKGVIRPAVRPTSAKVRDHGFFGCRASSQSVDRIMGQIRGGRCRDI